jgi:PAS domain-containing protein
MGGLGVSTGMSGKSQSSTRSGQLMSGDSEGLFSLVMSNFPARIWVKDAQGRYVFVNSRL